MNTGGGEGLRCHAVKGIVRPRQSAVCEAIAYSLSFLQAYHLRQKGPKETGASEFKEDHRSAAKPVDRTDARNEAAPGDVELAIPPEKGVDKEGKASTPAFIVEDGEKRADEAGGCSIASLSTAELKAGADDENGQSTPRGQGEGERVEVQEGRWSRALTLRESMRSILAVCVGILHGIAGPGGVLGVLPAVALSDPSQSGAYLASFCVSSILIMGVFAAAWGEVTGRMGSSDLATCALLAVSSCVSVVVGLFWLTLIATGTFATVFD